MKWTVPVGVGGWPNSAKTGHAQPWRMWNCGSEGSRGFLGRNSHQVQVGDKVACARETEGGTGLSHPPGFSQEGLSPNTQGPLPFSAHTGG